MKHIWSPVIFAAILVDSMLWTPARPAEGTLPEAALVVVTNRGLSGGRAGNGFVIGDGTLAVTCDHLVTEESKTGQHRMETLVAVFSPYLGQAAEARIVATDEELDLAVLEVPWQGHPALAVADANEIKSARSARVLGLPTVVRRLDDWDAHGSPVESFQVQTEELPVAFVGVRQGTPRFVTLEGIGQLGPGWSGAPILRPDSSIVLGCFASIGGTTAGGQIVRQGAKGAAVNQIPRLVRSVPVRAYQERLAASLRTDDVRLPSPSDAYEVCTLALRTSSSMQPGRYESALEPARAFVRQRPESATAHRMLAYACNEVGQVEEARESFRRARELDPNSFTTALLYAQFLGSRGEPDRARQILEPLWESGRSRDLVAVVLVTILGGQGQFARSLEILDEAIKDHPRNAYLWQQMAACRMQTQGPAAGIEPATRMVELFPERGPWRGSLARLLEHTGALDEAEKHFRKLLEVEPENPVVYCWLAEFLAQHRPQAIDEALKVAEKALGLPPRPALPREKIEELIGKIQQQIKTATPE
jgi:Flp pilus assembly protein TadD